MTGYLIAKFIPDLARNEPVNVGIIVYDGTRALARFDGESDSQQLDLRRVRHRIPSSRVYQQWVSYWRRALADPSVLDRTLSDTAGGDAAVMDRLLDLPARDFYLEQGGSILFDADRPLLDETLRELYERLVRGSDQPAVGMSLHKMSVETFRAAGVAVNDKRTFIERPEVTLQVHGIEVAEEFSFAVRNGRLHYVQEIGFDPSSLRRTRKEIGHALLLLDNVPGGEQGFAVFDGDDVMPATRPLLEVLRTIGPVIDVREPEPAAEQIRQLISI